MAKEKKALEPKAEGHKVYTFNKAYPLGGKKKGDQISLAKVPNHLKEYFDETAGEVTEKPQLVGELPDAEKATQKELLAFLHSNGVSKKETNGLSREDLILLLGPFYNM